MELTFVTANVRGIKNPTKRRALFASLAAMKGDVFLLQEVHLGDDQDVERFSREWVWGPSAWSVGNVHADGVGILCRGQSIEMQEAVSVIGGRVMFADINFNNLRLRVFNVYGPTRSRQRLEVFRELTASLSTSRSIVLGGDFNVSLDGVGAATAGVDYSARALAGLVRDYSLKDAFRAAHPGDPGFTWRNSRGAASRLDYIFVGRELGDVSCALLPSWASDHDMLRVAVKASGVEWGPGYWKFNVSLLSFQAFREAFVSFYSSVRTLRLLYPTVVEWWEAAKVRIGQFCRHYSGVQRRNERAEVRRWLDTMAYLHAQLNNGRAVRWEAYEGAKERVRSLLEDRAKALSFQARLIEMEEGEKPTAYFFQAARARKKASTIVGLRGEAGLETNMQNMLDLAGNFYSDLFSRRECDSAVQEELLDCVAAQLGEQEVQVLEARLTLTEVTAALSSMKDGRSPGHDGLPREFYHAFWDLIGPDLVEVFQALLEGGALSASMRKGVVTLLFKAGDRAELKNWRPITLLTVDYKLLAKVATVRLRQVIGGLVSCDQTCGVPGRSCSWNLVLLRDVIDWVQDRGLPLALVSIDQEKAFDRVQHDFLFRVLERMGFGPRFTAWLRMLYRGVYSCVRINGFLGRAVEQAGGVRQGCPLSPLLYVLYMEPFAELVRRDPGVDGVRIPGAAGVPLKIQQYADDTTLFVSSVQSLSRVRALVDMFARGTGSKVNLSKSSVLFCGQWREQVGDCGGFQRCEGGLKVLGVHFYPQGSAQKNWEARLAVVRSRLGLWVRRRLSLTGKVIVVRAILLPLLLHLAYVFPVPPRIKVALTRAIFQFLWGGRYEYVRRELMYMPVAKGGRGVPRIPLKLDTLYACFSCNVLLLRVPHKCVYFARLYLANALRHLEPLSHTAPRVEVLTPAYGAVVRFLQQCPAPVTRDSLRQHRVLYSSLANRQDVSPQGVPLNMNWGRISGGRAPGAVRDLHWLCAMNRLAVRELMHCRGGSATAFCPRGCGLVESVPHAFWECRYAVVYWGLVQGLLRRLDDTFTLSRAGVLFRKGLGVLGSVSQGVLWDVIGYAKWVLWEDRMAVVGVRVGVLTPCQLFHRFRGRVAEKIRVDRAVQGRDWVKGHWGGMEKIFSLEYGRTTWSS